MNKGSNAFPKPNFDDEPGIFQALIPHLNEVKN